MASPSTPITVRLDPNVADHVSQLADDLDRSVSWVVGQAVQLYLQGRPGTTPPMPAGVQGFLYEITSRFTLAPYDTADQLAHTIGDRSPAWLRQQGAADAYTVDVTGVRVLAARCDYQFPDQDDPVDGLREASDLEHARIAAAGPHRPLEESIAEVDARRAARRAKA